MNKFLIAFASVLLTLAASTAFAADIVQEWDQTKAPPALGVCGAGVQQRTVACVRVLSGTVESDAMCAGAHL